MVEKEPQSKNLDGINYRHVRVLLRKDYLTLKRNMGFVASFILMPILMITAFSMLQWFLEGNLTPEQHNFEYSKYTQLAFQTEEPFMDSGMSTKNCNKQGCYNTTIISGCGKTGRTGIGMILPKQLRQTLVPALQELLYKDDKKTKKYATILPFETMDELLYQVQTNKTKELCFGIEITDIRPDIDEINITMMFPMDVAQNTFDPIYDPTTSAPNIWNWNTTFFYGIPQFQLFATEAIVTLLTGKRMGDVQLGFFPMKTPEFKYLDNRIEGQLMNIFPFFYMCIFMLPLFYMVTKLAEEKETKAREGMKMMGLNDKSYFAAWFIFMLILTSTINGIIVAISQFILFQGSNILIIFAIGLLYGMTMYGFSFILVAFLPTKKLSANSASLIHFCLFCLGMAFKGSEFDHNFKMLLALIPNCSLVFSLQNAYHRELVGAGVKLSSITEPYNHFSVADGLIMLALDVVLYALVGYYCDQVAPREFGVPRPLTFPCRSKKTKSQQKNALANLGEEVHVKNLVQAGNFEEVPDSLKRASSLKIRGLRKEFGSLVAVKDTSMTMYNGQIYALLGHNGAGKTTTIQMLTGLLQPTAGQAQAFGYDVFEQQDEVRQFFGVCPQHNVLFAYLTVREHLELYATFKAVPSDKVKEKVENWIDELELLGQQNQLASTLSGGQKRKLSVGIALIGDSKLVLLDEPTSGMDTTTRRRFWEMLKAYKRDRIIILTTHHMDEADILGDQICILAEGEVQCSGTSLFLKKRFGVGFKIIFSKIAGRVEKVQSSSEEESESEEDDEGSESVESVQQEFIPKTKLDHFIKENIPEAKKLQQTSTETTFQIPESFAPKFKEFFRKLDKQIDELNIDSYGVGNTTLEEVFLKVGHGENAQKNLNLLNDMDANLTTEQKKLNDYSVADYHERGCCRQIRALANKKVITMTKDKSFYMDFLLPNFLIVIGLWLTTIDFIAQANFPIRDLNIKNFPQNQPLFYNQHNFNQTDGEVQEFIDRTMGNDIGTHWSHLNPIEQDHEDEFFEQLKYIDNQIFEAKNEYGPQYGSFMIQQADREERKYSIGIFTNMSQPTAPVVYTSYVLQSIARDLTGNPNLKINYKDKPLPLNLRLQNYMSAVQGMFATFLFSIAYMMMSDTIVQSIIKERQGNLKHQLMVSGATLMSYWIANFIVDFAIHLVTAGCTKAAIFYFEIDAPDIEHLLFWFSLANPLCVYTLSFIFDSDAKASVILRVFYAIVGGAAPIAMQILFIFNDETKDIWAPWLKKTFFQHVPIFNLSYGYLQNVNRFVQAYVMSAKKAGDKLKGTLEFNIMGESIEILQYQAALGFAFVLVAEFGIIQAFSRPLIKILKYVFFIVTYPIMCCCKKKKKLRKVEKLDDEDVDAQAVLAIEDKDPELEEKRVEKIKARDLQLRIHKLTKWYTPGQPPAVENVSFGLEQGECFALLGVTGAGKTSTFKCLTGEEINDGGSLAIGGNNVNSLFGLSSARALTGYCPQFDAIYEGMTVREHLELYAHIKGIKSTIQETLIQKQIKEMDLTSYENVQAQTLSGGNKRKLQCAIALIGNPPIVLLDEPSTGVDPQAKRFMWTIVQNISTRNKKSTVVLTTHSMDEAEALCPKIGIMVEGKFKCFGSAQYLKNKYGMGYELEVKIRNLNSQEIANQKKTCALQEFVKDDEVKTVLQKLNALDLQDNISKKGAGREIYRLLQENRQVQSEEFLKWVHYQRNGSSFFKELQNKFKKSAIIENYNNSFTFKTSRDNQSIGFVFGMIEELKPKYDIVEYSVNQTSLEQIFNIFARESIIRRKLAAQKEQGQGIDNKKKNQ